MQKHEAFERQHSLKERAETMPSFDETFAKDVLDYMTLLSESGQFDQFTYKMQDGKIVHYPMIGFIGSQGLTGVWKDPFPTCCRYAALTQASQELGDAETALNEVISRVQQAEKILPTIHKNKQEAALKKFEALKLTMQHLSVGIMTVKDMIDYVVEGKGSIDANKNEVAFLWKTYLERTNG